MQMMPHSQNVFSYYRMCSPPVLMHLFQFAMRRPMLCDASYVDDAPILFKLYPHTRRGVCVCVRARACVCMCVYVYVVCVCVC